MAAVGVKRLIQNYSSFLSQESELYCEGFAHCQWFRRSKNGMYMSGERTAVAVRSAEFADADGPRTRTQRQQTSANLSHITLWCPLLPYGYSYKHPVPDQVKQPFVIFDIRTLWRSGLSVRVRQSARMSKITNACLTRSATVLLYRCTHTATAGVKGIKY